MILDAFLSHRLTMKKLLAFISGMKIYSIWYGTMVAIETRSQSLDVCRESIEKAFENKDHGYAPTLIYKYISNLK